MNKAKTMNKRTSSLNVRKQGQEEGCCRGGGNKRRDQEAGDTNV